MRPYYVLTLLPGQKTEQFSLILPFTPQQRQNMVAWMAAPSDPVDYGKIVAEGTPEQVAHTSGSYTAQYLGAIM